MRFNSGRQIRGLTAKEQDGLLEMLLPAKQPEAFTMNRTVNSQPGSVQFNIGEILRALNIGEMDTDEKPRELTQNEIDVAESVFGDMIDLGEVRIGEKNWLARLLHGNHLVMTICNTIYGIDMPNDTLIHELVHVWQYDKEHIDPASAALSHIIASQEGETAELYFYSVDDIEDENRRTLRDYGFEEQAAIVQDAYLVIEEEQPPKRNKDYEGGIPVADDEALSALYERFMEDFREWHEELARTEQPNDERIEWLESGLIEREMTKRRRF